MCNATNMEQQKKKQNAQHFFLVQVKDQSAGLAGLLKKFLWVSSVVNY